MTLGTLTSEPPSPPKAFILKQDEVHVWQARLDIDLPQIAMWRSLLSADEHARAERYRFARDRHRYIVRRLILRTLLGSYLGIEPERVQFCYGPAGKPFLANDLEHTRIRFSLSHSDDIALFAFVRNRSIGIDLEKIKPDIIDELIAERFFSAAEAASLRALPRSLQSQAFFASWTEKEACVKAQGEGIVLGLNRFEVSVSPDGPARLMQVDGDARAATKWSLRRLSPRPDFAAALAIEGEGAAVRIQYRNWPIANGLTAREVA